MMKLDIKNFRSIKDQSVELAPITVLYGPNGSGKSSLLYSLLIMKNVILNLERQTGDFFNLDFADLGNFRAVVHNHQVQDCILFEIDSTEWEYPVRWRVVIYKDSIDISLLIHDAENSIGYNPTMKTVAPFENLVGFHGNTVFRGSKFTFDWEGIRAETHPPQSSIPRTLTHARMFEDLANAPLNLVRSIGIAPLQVAFSRGNSLSPQLTFP